MAAGARQPHSFEEVLARLSGVRRREDHATAACPVPGHRTPAGHLTLADGGSKALVTCQSNRAHAYRDICKALGFDSLAYAPEGMPPDASRVAALYTYSDASGRTLYQVVRYEPKGFRQRRPDGHGGWIWNLRGVKPVLYRLPQVLKASRRGETVYIVEGEKDCETLARLGLTATTNPGGAGKWRPDFSEALAGAQVVIIPDKDEVGRKHARQVAASLQGKASSLRVIDLPDREGCPVKDVSDWVAAGGSREELEALVAAGAQWTASEMEPTLPAIVVNQRQLREVTAEALAALEAANHPPQLFRRSGSLVRVCWDERGRPFIDTLSEAALRGALARAADFVRGGERGLLAVAPPLDVVRDILSLGSWGFPPLAGITEAPLLRPDGRAISEAGYDAGTGLFYAPAPGLRVPPVPERPSERELEAAVDLVLEALCDFPFTDPASRANALGALITPILRPMIEGPVPLPLIDKPMPGTGASLMADTISLLASGRLAATMGVPASEEEWEKKLSSHLLAGRSLCVIDNIEGKLHSDTLSRYITSTYLSVRPLGRSADLILPNLMTVLGTGNNICLGGDLPRRCLWIRLDAGMARPWMREARFRHPNLREWVLENRGAILGAILTLARAWVVAGRPLPPELPVLGAFEGFSRTVGGVLAGAGIAGFLSNLTAMYDHMDIDTPQWEGFLMAWRETIGEVPITVAELVKRLEESAELAAALPDSLALRDGRDYNRRLGNALAKRRGVRLPSGLMLAEAGERQRAKAWLVVSYENANSPHFEAKSELGELALTPAQSKTEERKSLYRKGAGNNSPNSPPDTKEGELGLETSPQTPDDLLEV